VNKAHNLVLGMLFDAGSLMMIPCGVKHVGILNVILNTNIQERTLCILCFEVVSDNARNEQYKHTFIGVTLKTGDGLSLTECIYHFLTDVFTPSVWRH
jgi:hypothetical protein